MPRYCVEGTGKELGEIKNVALVLEDWGDSVSICKVTINKHTQSLIPGPELAWHSGTRFIFSTTY